MEFSTKYQVIAGAILLLVIILIGISSNGEWGRSKYSNANIPPSDNYDGSR